MVPSLDIHPPTSLQMQPADSGDGGSSWQPNPNFDPVRFQYTAPQSFSQGSSPTSNDPLDMYLTNSASRSSERELDFSSANFTSLPFVPQGYPSASPRPWTSEIRIDTVAPQPSSSQFPWVGYTSAMPPSPTYANSLVSSQYRTDLNTHQPSPSHLSPTSTSCEGLLTPSYSSPSSSLHLLPELNPATPPLTPDCQGYSLVSSSPGGSGGSPFSGRSIDLPQVPAPLENQPKQLYSHHDQVQFFKYVASLAIAGPGPFVQQRMYKPHTNSDRRRYVEDVDLEYPIMFWSDHPHECGIPLSDALHSRVKRLLSRDETVFEGRGPSVSIRLEWPGYRQWSRQIPTKDFRSPPGPITRAKLAKNVAKCITRFINEKQNHPLEEEADERWRVGNNVGPGQIKLDDLILVSLHHVSMGSWQPHLKLRRPLR